MDDDDLSEESIKKTTNSFNRKLAKTRLNSKTNSARFSSSSDANLSQENWIPNTEWIISWKSKMPFQTIMRLLQVLVPQVEKICIDK